METTSLCLKTRLLVKKNFQILIIFIQINVNVCLLCDHNLTTGLVLHTRNLTVNKKSVTHLVFVSADFWGAEKPFFLIVPFRPRIYVLKSFRSLEVSNRVRNWNKVKNYIYVRSKFLLCQLEIPIFINILMCQSSLINSVSFYVLWT